MGTKPTTTKGTTKGTTTTQPVVTLVVPPKVTPQQLKGTSTVPKPVGVVWVTCCNLTIQNGGVTPTRSTLHKGCTNPPTHPGKTITHHTVRTQVNLFLQWVKGGCTGKVPRGVTIPNGVLPFTLGK
jgi:hypothetical protein